jgi:membrane associated rhomboid family serine protease
MPPDRYSMRDYYPRPRTTALVWVVAAMASCFVLQLTLLSPWLAAYAGLIEQLRLTVRGIQQWHLWTVLTHGLLHDTGFLPHIVFSLLPLVLIGRELEPQLGARRFAALFGAALLAGSLCWLALHWRHGGAHIGPSAGIVALFVVLARLYENQQMTFMPFFVFSVTLRPMHLVYGLAVTDALLLLVFELPGAALPLDYAPSAHLGGLITGLTYFRLFHANNGWDRAPGFSLPVWLRFPKMTPAPPGRTPALPRSRDPEHLRADVDRILDKINSQGFGSLTPEEKHTLDTARDLLSKG